MNAAIDPANYRQNLELTVSRIPRELRSCVLRLLSFCRYLHRHPDPARRGLLKRMRCKIDPSEQGQIDGPDGITQRLLVTRVLVSYGLEVDPHAMRADYLRGMLKAGIELVRSGRLTQVESSCAHPISNSELLILSRNIAGDERARN
jgi:hypothetical protein